MICNYSPDQSEKIIPKLYEHIEEHYFLLQAIDAKKHLSVLHTIEKNGKILELLAERKSGAYHYFSCGKTVLYNQIKMHATRRVLLHANTLRQLKKRDLNCSQEMTSVVMMRNPALDSLECIYLCEEVKICDLVDVVSLYKQTFSTYLSLEAQQRNLKQGGFGYKIVKDHQIIAIAQVGLKRKGKAYVFGVAVAKAYRGMGYGKAVMHALLCSKHAKGLTLYLLTDNQVAIRLYKSLGFEPKGNMYRLRYGE